MTPVLSTAGSPRGVQFVLGTSLVQAQSAIIHSEAIQRTDSRLPFRPIRHLDKCHPASLACVPIIYEGY